jgi:DNA helicase-4
MRSRERIADGADAFQVRTNWVFRLILRLPVRALVATRGEIVFEGGRLRVILRSDVRALTTIRGLFWDSLVITHQHGSETIRGLRHGLGTQFQTAWATLGVAGALESAVQRFEALLTRDAYLNHAALLVWRTEADSIRALLPSDADTLPLTQALKTSIRTFLNYRDCLESIVEARNEEYVARKQREHASWFATAGGQYGLNDAQQKAILHDEDNCLVIAGAGTGKTSTVAGKVGYLLHTGAAEADRVLLLAFTRKAAQEMTDRLNATFGDALSPSTFHKLGLDIVSAVEGRKPSVSVLSTSPAALKRAIREFVDELLDSPESRETILTYLAYFRVPYRSPFEFGSTDQRLRVAEAFDIRTLRGEVVKSHEEALIADWLFLHGVAYEYERPYEHDTATIAHRQYQPDFYLSEYGIYLEHFGVNRDGEPAPYIDAHRYRAQMEWKRDLHRVHGTVLVETYSWQRMEHRLYDSLHTVLTRAGVRVAEARGPEVIEAFRRPEIVDPLATLVATFLALYKSNAWSRDEVAARSTLLRDPSSGTARDSARDAAFLAAFELIRVKYEHRLFGAGHASVGTSASPHRRDVDFHDMIARAADYVESGRYQSRFTHIIVDECQDLSRGRSRLLRALLSQIPERRLFCVGDDWQSIYRFTGSDVSQMRQFGAEFGYYRECKLEAAHRSTAELLELSSSFIQQNPDQITKSLKSLRRLGTAAVVIRTVPARGNAKEQRIKSLQSALDEIAGRDGSASVDVLGRYNHTLPDADEQVQLAKAFSSLKLRWLTAHKAKGLEADYAIVLDVSAGKHGFPSGMVDDPILDLVLAAPSTFPNAEERRVFYVALTRARHRVYLLVPEANPSEFVEELRSKDRAGWVEGTPESSTGAPRCPECSGGLLLRKGTHGLYWRCSYRDRCDGWAKVCPSCQIGAIERAPLGFVCSAPKCRTTRPTCPRCSVGMLLPRKGGKLLGCSNFRPDSPFSCGYMKRADANTADSAR